MSTSVPMYPPKPVSPTVPIYPPEPVSMPCICYVLNLPRFIFSAMSLRSFRFCTCIVFTMALYQSLLMPLRLLSLWWINRRCICRAMPHMDKACLIGCKSFGHCIFWWAVAWCLAVAAIANAIAIACASVVLLFGWGRGLDGGIGRAIFTWLEAGILLKNTCKIARIFETELINYGADAFVSLW